MKQRLTTLVRILFGVFFIFMGLNFFFHFVPLPPMTAEGTNFMTALANVRYILPFNAGLQIVAGLMLALNLFAPLALILLAPLIVHIAFFHIFLDPGSIGLAVILVIVELFLAFMYWDNFAHLFRRK